VINIRDMVQT